MKIYTGYFARMKDYPKDVVPIAICAKTPDWYTGLYYPKLAPSYDILMAYKNHVIDWATYTKRFNNEILSYLDAQRVVRALAILSGGQDIVLLCYERDENLCHRSLVAKWLREFGYEVEELPYVA